MIDLPAALDAEAAKLHGTSPWIWLVELVADRTTSNRIVFRFCTGKEEITFEGVVWYPFEMSLPTFEQDSEGTLSRVKLSVSNVTGEVQHYADASNGFVDKDVRLLLVHRNQLGSSSNKLEVVTRVVEAAASPESVTFTLGMQDLFRYTLPRDTFQRNRCRFGFTSEECGFILPGATEIGFGDPNVENCDKTLDGTAGCSVHGNNERLRQRAVIHPTRYGGFPTIPDVVRQ